MIRHSLPRSSARRRLLIGVAGWLAGGTKTIESQAKEMAMTTKTMTLWQAIDALARQIPFSKLKVQSVLLTDLIERENPSNELFQFYRSNPIELMEGVKITNVDLRIKRSDAHPGFMVLNIDGACVTLNQVRAHYGGLEITDTPRGRSLDDVTSYTTKLSWGELSFSFKERKPECLASIAFDPKKAG